MQTKPQRKSLITRIHVAKAQLAMSEDAYRAMLMDETGRDSCTRLNDTQLQRVLKRMQGLGFKHRSPRSPRSRHKPEDEKTVVDKLRAVWIDMAHNGLLRDGSEAALAAWVKRTTTRLNGGQGVERVEWLGDDSKLAIRVLEALKQWQRRATEEATNE